MIDYIKYPEKNELEEAHDYGIQYTLIKNNTNLIPFVYCKDFFQDIIWSEITGNDVSIYGFEYSKLDILNDSLSIGIINRDNELENCHLKALCLFIKLFEKKHKIPKSIIYNDYINENYSIIIEFDKYWYSEPLLLSMFLLFIRIGIHFDTSSWTDFINNIDTRKCMDIDKYIIKNVKQNFIDIFNRKKIYHNNWIDFKDTHDIHNNSGIITEINKNT